MSETRPWPNEEQYKKAQEIMNAIDGGGMDTVGFLGSFLAEKDAEISALRASLAEKEGEIAALKADDVKAAPYRHMACKVTIENLQAQVRDLEAKLAGKGS